MTTATSEIDFSTFPDSDGEPMAETSKNMYQMFELIYSLKVLLRSQGRARVAVGGNQFLYYNEHNGRDHLSPDTYVALDVAPGDRPTWKTWEEGKCPDIVFEVTSPSTVAEDLSEEPRGKRRVYAELGAREYYVYDPNDQIQPRFRGFTARDGRFEPLPVLPGGGIMSALLEAELRPVTLPRGALEMRPAGTYLQVIDPRTGQPISGPEEEYHVNQDLREHLVAEEHLRITAEQRAARAEAALQEALAALESQRGRESASDQP